MNPQQQLAAMALLPDRAIDLPRGALLISALFQPGLDLDTHLAHLDDLCRAAAERVPTGVPLIDRVAALNRFLFKQEGFVGNLEDFYDPRNSFLDQVMARRTGIPITLALVYVAVAERLRIPAFGVSFPGHYLIRVGEGGATLVLDPFAQGLSLDESDLDRRLADLYGEGALTLGASPALLKAATRRGTLVRMLSNLKAIYFREGAVEQALIAVNGILTLSPDSSDDLRARGLIYRELGYVPAAIADLKRCVQLSEQGEEIAALEPIIAELEAGSVRVH